MQVGLTAVQAALAFTEKHNLPEELERLIAGLNEIVDESDLFDHVAAEGNLIRLNLNKSWFPFDPKSLETAIIELVLSKLILQASDVVILNLRLFLPNLSDRELNRRFLQQFKQGLQNLSAQDVYRFILDQPWEIVKHTAIPGFAQSRMRSMATSTLFDEIAVPAV